MIALLLSCVGGGDPDTLLDRRGFTDPTADGATGGPHCDAGDCWVLPLDATVAWWSGLRPDGDGGVDVFLGVTNFDTYVIEGETPRLLDIAPTFLHVDEAGAIDREQTWPGVSVASVHPQGEGFVLALSAGPGTEAFGATLDAGNETWAGYVNGDWELEWFVRARSAFSSGAPPIDIQPVGDGGAVLRLDHTTSKLLDATGATVITANEGGEQATQNALVRLGAGGEVVWAKRTPYLGPMGVAADGSVAVALTDPRLGTWEDPTPLASPAPTTDFAYVRTDPTGAIRWVIPAGQAGGLNHLPGAVVATPDGGMWALPDVHDPDVGGTDDPRAWYGDLEAPLPGGGGYPHLWQAVVRVGADGAVKRARWPFQLGGGRGDAAIHGLWAEGDDLLAYGEMFCFRVEAGETFPLDCGAVDVGGALLMRSGGWVARFDAGGDAAWARGIAEINLNPDAGQLASDGEHLFLASGSPYGLDLNGLTDPRPLWLARLRLP